jgi:hypothetical protein
MYVAECLLHEVKIRSKPKDAVCVVLRPHVVAQCLCSDEVSDLNYRDIQRMA